MSTEHAYAARIFSRLIVPAGLTGLGPFRICIESDLSDPIDVRLRDEYPDGATIACFYPDKHIFKLVRWTAGPNEFTEGRTPIKLGESATIGMVIDYTLRTEGSWNTRTIDTGTVEKELTHV